MKKVILSMFAVITFSSAWAQQQIRLTVNNPAKFDKENSPVVLKLSDYTSDEIRSALVRLNNVEVPCQLDDLNGDGIFDELCFVTNVKKQSKLTFVIELSTKGSPIEYSPRVYTSLMLRNKNIKQSNKHDIFLNQLTVENGTNVYSTVHQHGIVFESELVAFRVYFDNRQTVDLYGKYKKQLELQQTQFYPDSIQKAAGFGDDVLWVGQTFGLGAFRGWDGKEPTHLTDVDKRTQRIVASGPVRVIVEVKDAGWAVNSTTPKLGSDKPRITASIFYTLYAGHRDCHVDIKFNKKVPAYDFSTGLVNVKNSEEYTEHNGLRGCWGKDWPAGADKPGNKEETVGLGIYVPNQYVYNEEPANKDNYAFVIKTADNQIHYDITFCSDNETFGYHSAHDWFNYLKQWKRDLDTPIIIEK